MGIRLLLYLSILFIGILIGYKEISHKRVLNSIDKLQMIALVILLFVMDIRIGADELVIGSLGEIGFMAFIIALFSIFFSVLAVLIYRKIVGINNKGEKI